MTSRAANASSGDGNSNGRAASYFPEPARRLPARRDFLGATNRRAGSRRSDRSSGRNRPESRENFFKNLQGYPPKCPTPPGKMTRNRKNILCTTTKWNSGSKVGSISNPRRGAARGNTGRAGGSPKCGRSSAPRWTGPRPRPRVPSKFTCGSRGERGRTTDGKLAQRRSGRGEVGRKSSSAPSAPLPMPRLGFRRQRLLSSARGQDREAREPRADADGHHAEADFQNSRSPVGPQQEHGDQAQQ